MSYPAAFQEHIMSTVTVSGAQGQTISLQFDSAANASIARALTSHLSAGIANGSIVVASSADGSPVAPPAGKVGEWVQVDSGAAFLKPGEKAVINTAPSAVIFGAADANESIISGTGNLTFFAVAGGSGTVVAAGGNNKIYVPVADNGAWSVNTGDGNDTIMALGRGNDSISAGGGTNSIVLGAGKDTVYSSGIDHIQTGSGSATIVASDSASDQITGGSGKLFFVGGAGDATISIGTGSLTVMGGSGTGVFHGGTAGNNLLMAGDGAATLFGAGNGDVLYANGDHGQVLHAGAGSETLFGGLSSGNDMFYAGTGKTLITGGFGNDTFVAGTGNATIQSGVGADVFKFVHGAAGGSDLIQNMDGGDRIQLVGYGANEKANMISSQVNAGNNTMVTLSDNTKITFSGVSNLTNLNFLG
jgi:Ca2+-binding RTX toxin-like protein